MPASLIGRHPELSVALNVRAQRVRVLEAVVVAVGEHGYVTTSVTDVVRRARVSRSTFYGEFESKEACFADTLAAGCDVLEERVGRAVRSAADWREELRFGTRAWLLGLHEDVLFARCYLLEAHHVPNARDDLAARFARRVRQTLERSGTPVPPPDVLLLFTHGVTDLAAATLQAGRDPRNIENTVLGCAARLVAEDPAAPWS